MTRRLALRREALAELSPDDLAAVVGGATELCPVTDRVRKITEQLGCFGTINCPTFNC